MDFDIPSSLLSRPDRILEGEGEETPEEPTALPTYSKNTKIEDIILDAAERHGVDGRLMLGLARRESSLNPNARNTKSTAGGLYQFLDGTWKDWGGGKDKMDPAANADAAARMLKANLDYFEGDYDKALAAHHVGRGKAAQALHDSSIGDVDVSTRDWLVGVYKFAGPAGARVKAPVAQPGAEPGQEEESIYRKIGKDFGYFPEVAEGPAPIAPRTFGDKVSDNLRRAGAAFGGVVEAAELAKHFIDRGVDRIAMPGVGEKTINRVNKRDKEVYDLVSGKIAKFFGVTPEAGKGVGQVIEEAAVGKDWEKLSPAAQAERKASVARIDEARSTSGATGALWQSFKEAANDPGMFIEQVPNVLIMSLAGAFGGPGAALGAGALLQGGQVGSDFLRTMNKAPMSDFEKMPAFQELIASGVGPEEARRQLTDKFTLAVTAASTAASVLAQKVIPGGKSFEKALAGEVTKVTLPTIAKAIFGEATAGTAEEVLGQYFANLGEKKTVNPNKDLMEGIPETAGAAAALEGLMGGTAHGISGGLHNLKMRANARYEAELAKAKEQAQQDITTANTAADATQAFTRATQPIKPDDDIVKILAEAPPEDIAATLDDFDKTLVDYHGTMGRVLNDVVFTTPPDINAYTQSTSPEIRARDLLTADEHTFEQTLGGMPAEEQERTLNALTQFIRSLDDESLRAAGGHAADLALQQRGEEAKRKAFEAHEQRRERIIAGESEREILEPTRDLEAARAELIALASGQNAEPTALATAMAAAAPDVQAQRRAEQARVAQMRQQARQAAQTRAAEVAQQETEALPEAPATAAAAAPGAPGAAVVPITSRKALAAEKKRLAAQKTQNVAESPAQAQLRQASEARLAEIAQQEALMSPERASAEDILAMEEAAGLEPTAEAAAPAPTAAAPATAAAPTAAAPAPKVKPAAAPVEQGTDATSSLISRVIQGWTKLATSARVTQATKGNITHAAAERLGKLFKKNIVWFEATETHPGEEEGQPGVVASHGGGGFLLENDPGTIYLNVNSKESAVSVVAHEILHAIKIEAPEVYKILRDKIKADFDNHPERFEEFRGYYNAPGMSDEALLEEAIADGLGNQARDPVFWANTFARIAALHGEEKAKGIIARLRNALVRVISAAINELGSKPGFDNFITNLEEVSEAFEVALADYAEGKRTGVMEPRTRPAETGKTGAEAGKAGAETGETGKSGAEAGEPGEGAKLSPERRGPYASRRGAELTQQVEKTPTRIVEKDGQFYLEPTHEAAAAATREEGAGRAPVAEQRGTSAAQQLREGSERVAPERTKQGLPEHGAAQEHSVQAVGTHYSRGVRGSLSSAYYGSGLKGEEGARLANADPRLRERVYFYLDSGQGTFPEAGVGSHAHEVKLNNLYDLAADPLKLRTKDLNSTELAILEAGFDGYMIRDFGKQGAAVLLGSRSVPVKHVGTGAQGPAGRTIPPPVLSEERRIAKTLTTAKNLPAGELPAQRWGAILEATYPEVYRALEKTGVFNSKEPMYASELAGNYLRASQGKFSPPRYEQGQTLPARWPTAVEASPRITDELLSDFPALARTPRLLEQAVAAVGEEPGLRPPAGSAEERAGHIIQYMKDNLLWLYDQVPQEIRQRSKLWYDGASKIASRWAQKYDITKGQAAGILAVLSPQKDWFMNTTMAERVLDVLVAKKEHRFDKAMDAAAFKFLAPEFGKEGGEERANIEAYEFARDKTLQEVLDSGNRIAAGVWLRAYDEAYNASAYSVVTPEGEFSSEMRTGEGELGRRAWGAFRDIGKAASIFLDGSAENINASLGKQHKVRNFYNNIFAPGDPRYATMDTHAVGAAHLRPLGSTAKAVEDNFGGTGASAETGVGGSYPLYFEANKQAAEARGISPREMQSITWEAVRGLFSPGFKTKANLKAIDGIWGQVDEGTLSRENARQQILELAGAKEGIPPPDWWGENHDEMRVVMRDSTFGPRDRAVFGQGIAFPGPEGGTAAKRWSTLSPEIQADVAHRLTWRIAAKAIASLDSHTARGELRHMHGGVGDNAAVNTYSIEVDPRMSGKAADTVARLVGFALRAKEVLRTSPVPFKTAARKPAARTVAAFVNVGENATAADVNSLYAELRSIKYKGKPIVSGHATNDGSMVLMNDPKTGLSDEQFAKLIAGKVGERYEVGQRELYVERIEKGTDDYGFKQKPAAGGRVTEPSVVETANQLRAESDGILAQLVVDAARGGASFSNARSQRDAGVREYRANLEQHPGENGYRSRAEGIGSVRIPGLTTAPVAAYELPAGAKQQLNAAGIATPALYELHPADAAVFQAAISATKEGNDFAASVYVYPEEDYQDMRLFLDASKKAGFALKGQDIVSVFNSDSRNLPGAAHAMLQLAIQQGGQTLDAFDTTLPHIYNAHGLRAVARLAWNEGYKPDGWNKKTYKDFNGGEPDVVFMALDPTWTAGYHKGQGTPVETYEEGQQRQKEALELAKYSPIRAWHGSPYDFDEFSLAHLGRGEGAQAFGHGLYFTDTREVAEWYRDNLSSRQGKDPTRRTFGGRTINGWYSYFSDQANRVPYDQARPFYDRMTLLERTEITWNPYAALIHGKDEGLSEEAMQWFEKTIAKKFQRPGRTYEVELRNPDENSYLLWDAPLNDQPNATAIREIAEDAGLPVQYSKKVLTGELTGEDFYRALSSEFGGDAAASKYLHSWGIPGIKYRDQASRGQPSGAAEATHNYVVFDDRDVTISAKHSPVRKLNGEAPAKDWEEKTRIRSRNGEPKTMYRGAMEPLVPEHFKEEATGMATNRPSAGLGVWFTDDAAEAGRYGEVARYKLDIRKPLLIRVEDVPVFDSTNQAARWAEAKRAAGYDGLVITAKHLGGQVNVVAFNPDQVLPIQGEVRGAKMSTPRFTAGQAPAASWTLPEPKTIFGRDFNEIRAKFQDKLVDAGQIVRAIGNVVDKWDVYLQETLYHGRAAKMYKDFAARELRPLLQDMKARGITKDEFETYLWNRHAEERNVQIAKINPVFDPASPQFGGVEGSGINTADARAYLAGLPTDKANRLEALAKRVDAINAETAKLLVDYGLESAGTIGAWQQAYQKYVPLFRERDGDFDAPEGMGTGAGMSVAGSASKRAVGSARKVENILAHVAMQRERTITRGEKNAVALSILGLAMSNPNPDFWAPIRPGSDPTKLAATLQHMGLPPATVANIANAPTVQAVDPSTGLVRNYPNPMLANSPNVISARVNGENRYLALNMNEPAGKRLATGLKNLDAVQLNAFLKMMGVGTRWLAAVNTQYNPLFGIKNLLRDLGSAALNLSTTQLAGSQAKILTDGLRALPGIMSALRAERTGVPSSNPWGALWDEFQNEGGQTGYREAYATSEDRAKALESDIKALARGRTMKGLVAMRDLLSDYNEMMENGVRLAAYKEAKAQGMSNARAADLAKNLTVNFNRKGTVASQLGALYAFFNASMQGTSRLAQTLAGPAGRKIIAAGVFLGVLQQLLLAGAGYDDDDVPDYEKERNLIIPIPGRQYLKIPMPLGPHLLPNFGRMLTELTMSGKTDRILPTLAKMGSMLTDSLNPFGGGADLLTSVTPTVADPFLALARNTDWTGKPIARQDFNSLAPTPGFSRAKASATPWAKALAEAVNWATGGTDFKPGLASPTPDQIDYLFSQIGGGVAREVSRLGTVVDALYTGDELPASKIPIANIIYGQASGQTVEGTKFYSNVVELNKHEAELKGYAATGRRDEIQPYLQEHPEARLFKVADNAQQAISKLRKQRELYVKAGASRDAIKGINDQITGIMATLNNQVTLAKEHGG